jgi:transcription termination factor NusA
VTSEADYNRELKEAYDSLLDLNGVGEKTALNLYQAGFRSAEDVAKAPVSDLVQLKDIGKEKAKKIIESAVEKMKQAAEAEEEGIKETAPEAVEEEGIEETAPEAGEEMEENQIGGEG